MVKNAKFGLYLLILIAVLLPSVLADQIAYDDFECNGFNCGTGWNGAWGYSGTCEITTLSSPQGTYQMRGVSSCLADRSFDDADYGEVTLSFWATATSLESADHCYYYYYDGASYNLLLTLNDGDDTGVLQYYEYNVSTYGLNTNAGIRMQAPTTTGDYCYIDTINVAGSAVAPSMNIYMDAQYPVGQTDVEISMTSSASSTGHTLQLFNETGGMFCEQVMTSPAIPFTSFSTTCDMPDTPQTNAKAFLFQTSNPGINQTKYFNVITPQHDTSKLGISRVYFSPQVLQGSSTEIFAVITKSPTVDISSFTVTLTQPNNSTRRLSFEPTVNANEYRAFITDTYYPGNVPFTIRVEGGVYYDTYSSQYTVAPYNIDFVDVVNKVDKILTQPPNIDVLGTYYEVGDEGKVIAQLSDNGAPINDATCYASIYYPSGNVLVRNQYMTYVPNSDGLYVYDITIPNTVGVYPASVACDYQTYEETYFVESFDMIEVIYVSGTLPDTYYEDGNKIHFHSVPSGNGNSSLDLNFVFNVSGINYQNATEFILHWIGSCDTMGAVGYIEFYNWNTSAWDTSSTTFFHGATELSFSALDPDISHYINASDEVLVKMRGYAPTTFLTECLLNEGWEDATFSPWTRHVDLLQPFGALPLTSNGYNTIDQNSEGFGNRYDLSPYTVHGDTFEMCVNGQYYGTAPTVAVYVNNVNTGTNINMASHVSTAWSCYDIDTSYLSSSAQDIGLVCTSGCATPTVLAQAKVALPLEEISGTVVDNYADPTWNAVRYNALQNQTGRINKGYFFDGNDPADHYILLTDSGGKLDWADGQTQVQCLSFKGTSSARKFQDSTRSDTSRGVEMEILSNGKVKVTVRRGGSTSTVLSTTAGLNDGAWHTMCFSSDGSTGTVTLYVNGVSEGTSGGSTAAVDMVNRYYGVDNTLAFDWDGYMDELCSYAWTGASPTIASVISNYQTYGCVGNYGNGFRVSTTTGLPYQGRTTTTAGSSWSNFGDPKMFTLLVPVDANSTQEQQVVSVAGGGIIDGTYSLLLTGLDSIETTSFAVYHTNTTGLTNISLNYTRECVGREVDDYFYAQVSTDNSTWTTLENITGNSVETMKSYELPSQFWNQTNFYIRFGTESDSSTDKCYVDLISYCHLYEEGGGFFTDLLNLKAVGIAGVVNEIRGGGEFNVKDRIAGIETSLDLIGVATGATAPISNFQYVTTQVFNLNTTGIIGTRLTYKLGGTTYEETGATCNINIYGPASNPSMGPKIVDEGVMTELGSGTYFYSFVPEELGIFTVETNCEKSGRYYYGMTQYRVEDDITSISIEGLTDLIQQMNLAFFEPGSNVTTWTISGIYQEYLNESAVMFFSGTEYNSNENATLAVQMIKTVGGGGTAPIIGLSCNNTILYPDHSIFDSQIMTEIQEGIYHHDFITPSTEGVYIAYAVCTDGSKNYYGMHSFHVAPWANQAITNGQNLGDIYDLLVFINSTTIEINGTTHNIYDYLQTTIYSILTDINLTLNNLYTLNLDINYTVSTLNIDSLQTRLTNIETIVERSEEFTQEQIFLITDSVGLVQSISQDTFSKEGDIEKTLVQIQKNLNRFNDIENTKTEEIPSPVTSLLDLSKMDTGLIVLIGVLISVIVLSQFNGLISQREYEKQQKKKSKEIAQKQLPSVRGRNMNLIYSNEEEINR